MTKADPKLIEAVARAICKATDVDPDQMSTPVEEFTPSSVPMWHYWKISAEQHIAANQALLEYQNAHIG